MNLLALDTSTDCCSVALRVGDAVEVRRHPGAREQTAHVLPLVQALLAEAGVSLRDLDAIACAHGPGAFTGVRVAVGVVQGLAYGARRPAIGVSTLAALAQQAVRCATMPVTHLLPVLDARMGELYAGAYVMGADGLVEALAPDRLVRPDDFAAGLPAFDGAWCAVGSGWAAYPSLADNVRLLAPPLAAEPDAEDVLALAARQFARGETVVPERLLPVYLRDTVAWKKLGEQGAPVNDAVAIAWDHPAPHLLAMQVGRESIDVMGHANNVEYLRWLEHVAWDHSNRLGLDWAAYRQLDRAMVARRTELEYLAPAFEGDELLLATWIVANDGRVSITREYQVVRPQDGKTLLRGRTQWVCVAISSGALKRMPPEFVAGYRTTA